MKLLLKNKKIDIKKSINLKNYKTNIKDNNSLVNIEGINSFIKQYTTLNINKPIPIEIGGIQKGEILGEITVKELLDRIFYKK